jgi:hypothetical protein
MFCQIIRGFRNERKCPAMAAMASGFAAFNDANVINIIGISTPF